MCHFLVLRKNCDVLRFFIHVVAFFSFHGVVLGQIPKTQIKVLQQGTTLDSIRVTPAQKGELFMEVVSYFEEYSSTEPASRIQMYFQGQNKQGELEVRYVYTYAMLNFHLDTLLTYSNNSKQTFLFDQSRRAGLLVEVDLQYKPSKLEVKLR